MSLALNNPELQPVKHSAGGKPLPTDGPYLQLAVEHGVAVDEGEVLFEGRDIAKMSPKELKPLRRDIQM